MVRVGSARIDENGNLTGGKAGDQTGQEVMIEPWYRHSKGWVVIRAVNDVVRERIAQDMEYACANDHIGYDQSTSWDLYDKSKAYDWDCSKVTVDTETDCSSLVRVCVAYAVQEHIPWFSTLNEKAVLRNTGLFQILTDSMYTNGDTYLKRGDILCTKTQGHTVVVIDNGSGVTTDVGNTSLCGTGKGTAVAVTAMNIREGASMSAAVIATISAGTAVEVLSASGGWYKIVWPGAACGYAYTAKGAGYYSYTGAELCGISVGDDVYYSGTAQYVSAYSMKAVTASPCNAQVTQYEASGAHKYHVKGDNVYGWVDEYTLTEA